MKSTAKRCALVLLVMAAAVPLQGYLIRPFPDVHETMTRASKRCLDKAAPGAVPAECWRLMETPRATWNVFTRFARWLTGRKYRALEAATRWPDVPMSLPITRFTDDTVEKRWLTLDPDCVKRYEARGATRAHIDDGLTCNSHFGSMQFFHAQASGPGEPAGETREKILGWADFLFEVASGMRDGDLDREYCDVFARPAGGGDAFLAAMLPWPDAGPCMSDGNGPWLLTDLFTMDCDYFTDAAYEACTVDRGSGRHETSRLHATGALLHVIQDSFSESHCIRGGCEAGQKPEPRVVCDSVKMFTNYTQQDSRAHTAADQPPEIDRSCRQAAPPIDDPMTAGARALGHIDAARAAGTEADRRRIRDRFSAEMARLFTLADDVQPAGPGECFRKAD